MRKMLIASALLAFASSAYALPPGAPVRYTNWTQVPGSANPRVAITASNAIRAQGFYQPSSLTVSVGAHAGNGNMRFTNPTGPGATATVAPHGTTTFTVPTSIVGNGPVRSNFPRVRVQNVGIGNGMQRVTITAK